MYTECQTSYKLRRRKKLTYTKELHKHQNEHTGESVTPKVATFSCNVCSHQGLSTYNPRNVERAIRVPCRLRICKDPGLAWSPYHVDQLSYNHLGIYALEPPLPHTVANRPSSRFSFGSSQFASEKIRKQKTIFSSNMSHSLEKRERRKHEEERQFLHCFHQSWIVWVEFRAPDGSLSLPSMLR